MKAKLTKLDPHYFLIVDGKTFGSTMEPHLSASIRHALSLKNCQAIERGYDLDELAKEHLGNPTEEELNKVSEFGYALYNSNLLEFKKGFQKALEILGDRRFTEEDVLVIRNKFVDILPTGDVSAWDMIKASKEFTSWFDEYTQSLQQDEWEVEIIEEEPLVAKARQINGEYVASKLIESTIFPKPKLDADGRLILKRVV